jgi:hypothetical protein
LLKEDKIKKHQELVGKNHGEKPKLTDLESSTTLPSFDEANKLLSLCLGLEDQLWAMQQSPVVSKRVKNLWSSEMSRVHTAYGRLSSLLDIPDPEILADLGLVNIGD